MCGLFDTIHNNKCLHQNLMLQHQIIHQYFDTKIFHLATLFSKFGTCLFLLQAENKDASA